MKTLATTLLFYLAFSLNAQERLSDFKSNNAIGKHYLIKVEAKSYEIVLGNDGVVMTYSLNEGIRTLNHSRSFDLTTDSGIFNNHTVLLRSHDHLILYNFLKDTHIEVDLDPCDDIGAFSQSKKITDETFVISYVNKCLPSLRQYRIIDQFGNLTPIEPPYRIQRATPNFLVLLDGDDYVLWSLSDYQEKLRINRLTTFYGIFGNSLYYVQEEKLKVADLSSNILSINTIGDYESKRLSKFVLLNDIPSQLAITDSIISITQWAPPSNSVTIKTLNYKETGIGLSEANFIGDYLVVELENEIHCTHLSFDESKNFIFPNFMDRDISKQAFGNSLIAAGPEGAKYIDMDGKTIKSLDSFHYQRNPVIYKLISEKGIYIKRANEELKYLDFDRQLISNIDFDYAVNSGIEDGNIFEINETIYLKHQNDLFELTNDSIIQLTDNNLFGQPFIGTEHGNQVLIYFESDHSNLKVIKTDGITISNIGTIPLIIQPFHQLDYYNGLLAYKNRTDWFLFNSETGKFYFVGSDSGVTYQSSYTFYEDQFFYSNRDSTVCFGKDGLIKSFPYTNANFHVINGECLIYYKGIGVYDASSKTFNINSFGKEQDGYSIFSQLSKKDTSILFEYSENGAVQFYAYKNQNITYITDIDISNFNSYSMHLYPYWVFNGYNLTFDSTIIEIVKTGQDPKNLRFKYPRIRIRDIELISDGVRLYCFQLSGSIFFVKDIHFKTATETNYFVRPEESDLTHNPVLFTFKNEDYITSGKSLYRATAQGIDKVKGVNLSNDDSPLLFTDDYIYYIGVDPFKGNQLFRYNPESPNSLKEPILNPKTAILYPNPASDQLILNNISNFSQIRIYNSTGSNITNLHISQTNINLSTQDWGAGVYYIQLLQKTGASETHKVIKI